VPLLPPSLLGRRCQTRQPGDCARSSFHRAPRHLYATVLNTAPHRHVCLFDMPRLTADAHIVDDVKDVKIVVGRLDRAAVLDGGAGSPYCDEAAVHAVV
jgi:hypothetical protein